MTTIWLASYPKCGNTWFRALLTRLRTDDDRTCSINRLYGSMASDRSAFDNTLFIESGLLTHDESDRLRPLLYRDLARNDNRAAEIIAEGRPAVRFVKTHDAYTRTSTGEPMLAGAGGARAGLLLVRDPRDVAASLANHSQCDLDRAIEQMNHPEHQFCGSTDHQADQLRQRLLGWSGYIESWLDQTDIPVHVVRYEDMIEDTAATLRRSLHFAGYSVNDAQIERAVQWATLSEMRRQEADTGFGEAPPGTIFFRRGEAGGWRDELSSEQVRRIELANASVMRRLGYGENEHDRS